MATLNIGRVSPGWKGAYNPSTTYERLDAVSFNGSSYLCIQDPPKGSDPTNGTYWQVISERGDDGVDGAQGPQGPQGPQVQGTLQ